MTGLAAGALAVVRDLAGDHVRHSTYFTGFPAGVPDTARFWAACLTEAITDPVAAAKARTVPWTGPDGQEGWAIDLLSLPSYGRYQHSFEEMLAAHEELIEALADRVTILDLAGPLEAEAQALYLRLAGSPVPLSVDDAGALRVLAGACAGGVQPDQAPVRESRAVINAARVRAAALPLVTTVTDVLRLACELSGADVSLQAPPRFRSLRRAWRAALMGALDQAAAPGTLAEVNPHAEMWKRLGERLHPHEWPQYPRAQAVFAAARGGQRPRSLAARVEESFAAGDAAAAAGRLAAAPGMLWRSADRVIRAAGPGDQAAVMAPAAGGRPAHRRAGPARRPGALPEPARRRGGAGLRQPQRPRLGRRRYPAAAGPLARRRPARGRGRRDHPAAPPHPGRHRHRHRGSGAAAVGQAAPGRAGDLPPRIGHPGRRGAAAVLHLLAASLPPDRLRPVRPVPRRGLGQPAEHLLDQPERQRRGTLRGHHRRPRARRGERVHQHPAHRAGTGIHHPPGPHLLRRRIRTKSRRCSSGT